MLLVFCAEQVLLAFEIFVACCQLVFLSQTDPVVKYFYLSHWQCSCLQRLFHFAIYMIILSKPVKHMQ